MSPHDVGRVTRFCSLASGPLVGPKFDAIWSVRLGFVGEVWSLLTPNNSLCFMENPF